MSSASPSVKKLKKRHEDPLAGLSDLVEVDNNANPPTSSSAAAAGGGGGTKMTTKMSRGGKGGADASSTPPLGTSADVNTSTASNPTSKKSPSLLAAVAASGGGTSSAVAMTRASARPQGSGGDVANGGGGGGPPSSLPPSVGMLRGRGLHHQTDATSNGGVSPATQHHNNIQLNLKKLHQLQEQEQLHHITTNSGFNTASVLSDLDRHIFTTNFSAPSTINAVTNRVLRGTLLRLNFPDLAAVDQRMMALGLTKIAAGVGGGGGGSAGNHNLLDPNQGSNPLGVGGLGGGVLSSPLPPALMSPSELALQIGSAGKGVISPPSSSSCNADLDFYSRATALNTVITDATEKVKGLLKDEVGLYGRTENAARSAEVKQKGQLSIVRAMLGSTSDRLRTLEDRLSTAAASTIGIEHHLSQASARVRRGKSIGILLRYFSALDSVKPDAFKSAMGAIAKNRERQRLLRTNEWKYHPHLTIHTNPLYFLTADPALMLLQPSATGVFGGSANDLMEIGGDDGAGGGASSSAALTSASKKKGTLMKRKKKGAVAAEDIVEDEEEDGFVIIGDDAITTKKKKRLMNRAVALVELDDADGGNVVVSASTAAALASAGGKQLRRRKVQIQMTPQSHEDEETKRINKLLLEAEEDDGDDGGDNDGGGGRLKRKQKRAASVASSADQSSNSGEKKSDDDSTDSSSSDDDDDDGGDTAINTRANKKSKKHRRGQKLNDDDSSSSDSSSASSGEEDDSDEEAISNLNNHLTAAGAPIKLHATETAAIRLGIPRVFACRYLMEDAVRRIAQLKPFVEKSPSMVVPPSQQQQQGNSKKNSKQQQQQQQQRVITASATNPIEENNPNAFANITYYAEWLENEMVKETLHLVKTYASNYRESVGGGTASSASNKPPPSTTAAPPAAGTGTGGATTTTGKKRTLKRGSTLPSARRKAAGGSNNDTGGGGGVTDSGDLDNNNALLAAATTPSSPNYDPAIANNTKLHKTILKALEEINILYSNLTGGSFASSSGVGGGSSPDDGGDGKATSSSQTRLLDAFLKSSLMDIKVALNQRLRLTPLPPAPPLPKDSTFWAMDIFKSYNKTEMSDFTQFLVNRTRRELLIANGFGSTDASASTTRRTLLTQIINNGLRPFLEMTLKEASNYSTDLVAQKARLSPRSEQKSRRRVNDAIAYTLSMNAELFVKGKAYGKAASELVNNNGATTTSISSTGGDNLFSSPTSASGGSSGGGLSYEESLVQSTIDTIFADTRRTYVTQSHEKVLLLSYYAETDYEYRLRLAVNADESYDYRPDAHTPKAREIMDRAKECLKRALILSPEENLDSILGDLINTLIKEIAKFLKKELEKTKESCQKDAKRWYEGETYSKIKTREQAYEKYIKNADGQSHICALRLLVWAQSTLIELFDLVAGILGPIASEHPQLIAYVQQERTTNFAPIDALSEEILNLVLNAIVTRTLTIFKNLQMPKDYYNPNAKGRNATTNVNEKSNTSKRNAADSASLDPTQLQLNGNTLACQTACHYLALQLSQALSFIRLSSLPFPKDEEDDDDDEGNRGEKAKGGGGAKDATNASRKAGVRIGGDGLVGLSSPSIGPTSYLEDDSVFMSPAMRNAGGGGGDGLSGPSPAGGGGTMFGGVGGAGGTANSAAAAAAGASALSAVGEYDFWATVTGGSGGGNNRKNSSAGVGSNSANANQISASLAGYLARRAAFNANGPLTAIVSPPSAGNGGGGSGGAGLDSPSLLALGLSPSPADGGGGGSGGPRPPPPPPMIVINSKAAQPLFPTPQHLPHFIKSLRLRDMLYPKIPTFARVLGVSLYKGITAHLRSFLVDDVGAITYQQDVSLIRSTMEPLILSGRLDGIVVGVLFDIVRETANGFMVLFDKVVPVFKSGYLQLLEYDEKVQYWRMRADMRELFKSTGIGS